jgi:flagellar hook-associated protein 3 FlgL
VSNTAAGDQALVNFDPAAKTLEIDIRPGSTRARTVVNALNATGLFAASLDNESDLSNDGSGMVDATATTVLSGGSGIVLDKTSGIQILNKGTTYTISFDGAETVEDVLNILNASEADVVATINDDGTGIDIRSRVSGADFAIGENGGTTATELGIRSFTTTTLLGDLNFGRGVDTVSGDDLVIQRRDGVNLQIDLSSAVTVGDVLDLINLHPSNVGNPVVAQLAAVGNGIELIDANAAGGSTLTVSRTGSFAAVDLGFVAPGESQAVASPAGGAIESLQGRDVNTLETKSVFNTLLRLEDALYEFDLGEIERTARMLDDDFQRVNFARADLGTRARYLESVGYQLDDEEIDLRTALSDEIDVDMVEAISNLTMRQANLQATLQLVGRTMQLSLLNFV